MLTNHLDISTYISLKVLVQCHSCDFCVKINYGASILYLYVWDLEHYCLYIMVNYYPTLLVVVFYFLLILPFCIPDVGSENIDIIQ